MDNGFPSGVWGCDCAIGYVCTDECEGLQTPKVCVRTEAPTSVTPTTTGPTTAAPTIDPTNFPTTGVPTTGSPTDDAPTGNPSAVPTISVETAALENIVQLSIQFNVPSEDLQLPLFREAILQTLCNLTKLSPTNIWFAASNDRAPTDTASHSGSERRWSSTLVKFHVQSRAPLPTTDVGQVRLMMSAGSADATTIAAHKVVEAAQSGLLSNKVSSVLAELENGYSGKLPSGGAQVSVVKIGVSRQPILRGVDSSISESYYEDVLAGFMQVPVAIALLVVGVVFLIFWCHWCNQKEKPQDVNMNDFEMSIPSNQVAIGRVEISDSTL